MKNLFSKKKRALDEIIDKYSKEMNKPPSRRPSICREVLMITFSLSILAFVLVSSLI